MIHEEYYLTEIVFVKFDPIIIQLISTCDSNYVDENSFTHSWSSELIPIKYAFIEVFPIDQSKAATTAKKKKKKTRVPPESRQLFFL